MKRKVIFTKKNDDYLKKALKRAKKEREELQERIRKIASKKK